MGSGEEVVAEGGYGEEDVTGVGSGEEVVTEGGYGEEDVTGGGCGEDDWRRLNTILRAYSLLIT